ncbi:hypothetical protein M407DRAFT_20705 [Tulasnella calospora MUT 4182]|uniref:F-box domain-containing protein n=1 Tax=Tulasnella calospora MUT 4182 TaxID=1051891 RepID=A0A0C3QPK6_9AGAM|nr:hypothetical protein M407DRAFT_20705 [Tulasnella calospora MUT 4182]
MNSSILHSGTAPITKLSTEILDEIFFLACQQRFDKTSLKSLTKLALVFIDWANPFVEMVPLLQNLRYLRLYDVRIPSESDLVTILRSSPSLQRLVLHVISSAMVATPNLETEIVLSQLRRLVVGWEELVLELREELDARRMGKKRPVKTLQPAGTQEIRG